MLTPRYREAYPKLDVLQGSVAHRRGRDICAYRNESGRPLGVVQFVPQDDLAAAVLKTQLHGPYLTFWVGSATIELLKSTNEPQGIRRAAACPACGGRVQTLFYVTSWACAACHKLLYRRQLVDRLTLAAEDLVEAEERLSKRRARGEHQRKFAERQAADQATVERLRPLVSAPWQRVASVAHQPRVDGVWMSLTELRDHPDLGPMYGSDF